MASAGGVTEVLVVVSVDGGVLGVGEALDVWVQVSSQLLDSQISKSSQFNINKNSELELEPKQKQSI